MRSLGAPASAWASAPDPLGPASAPAPGHPLLPGIGTRIGTPRLAPALGSRIGTASGPARLPRIGSRFGTRIADLSHFTPLDAT